MTIQLTYVFKDEKELNAHLQRNGETNGAPATAATPAKKRGRPPKKKEEPADTEVKSNYTVDQIRKECAGLLPDHEPEIAEILNQHGGGAKSLKGLKETYFDAVMEALKAVGDTASSLLD